METLFFSQLCPYLQCRPNMLKESKSRFLRKGKTKHYDEDVETMPQAPYKGRGERQYNRAGLLGSKYRRY